jgi:hypothetical protein
MTTKQVAGRVTPSGELIFETPKDLPPGDVLITIEPLDARPSDSETFTEDELRDLLTFTPKSGAEVVAAGLTGGWEHKAISDPIEWVEEQRRKQRERRGW